VTGRPPTDHHETPGHVVERTDCLYITSMARGSTRLRDRYGALSPGAWLLGDSSTCFESPAQLVDLGLIRASPAGAQNVPISVASSRLTEIGMLT
jgi:hypothetical protein